MSCRYHLFRCCGLAVPPDFLQLNDAEQGVIANIRVKQEPIDSSTSTSTPQHPLTQYAREMRQHFSPTTMLTSDGDINPQYFINTVDTSAVANTNTSTSTSTSTGVAPQSQSQSSIMTSTWSSHEQSLLRQGIYECGVGAWNVIAQKIPQRVSMLMDADH